MSLDAIERRASALSLEVSPLELDESRSGTLNLGVSPLQETRNGTSHEAAPLDGPQPSQETVEVSPRESRRRAPIVSLEVVTLSPLEETTEVSLLEETGVGSPLKLEKGLELAANGDRDPLEQGLNPKRVTIQVMALFSLAKLREGLNHP